jgi:hypothetical protein
MKCTYVFFIRKTLSTNSVDFPSFRLKSCGVKEIVPVNIDNTYVTPLDPVELLGLVLIVHETI